MAKAPFAELMDSNSQAKNWEKSIQHVYVERCDPAEDPLGFRAVFSMEDNDFAVGASYLAQRWQNLKKAGFAAPMTQKAMALIEEKIGRALHSAGEFATA